MVLKDVDKKSCLSYSERTTSKIPSGSPEPGQCQVLSIMFFLYALHHRYMVADIYLSFVWCSLHHLPWTFGLLLRETGVSWIQHCCTCRGSLVSKTTVWLMEKGRSHTQSGYPDKGMLSIPGRSAALGDDTRLLRRLYKLKLVNCLETLPLIFSDCGWIWDDQSHRWQ